MKKLSLDEIQQLELKILTYIVDVCEEHNIKYFLSYGTLLGAIRHQGFIPWDDDIDLVMMRDDYNRFIEIVAKHPDSRYRVLSPKDNGYYYTFVKVVDTHTTVVEEQVEDMPVNGVWVDVFPLDNVKSINSIHTRICYLLNKCRAAAIYKAFPKDKGIRYPIWKLCKLLGPFFFLRLFETICDLYKNKKCKYVSVISNPYRNMFERTIFDHTYPVSFEGRVYSAPKESDKLLTLLYGKYMDLPPVEKRTSHLMEAYEI